MISDQDLFKKIIPEAKRANQINAAVRFGKKSQFWYHRFFNFILNLVYSKEKKDSYFNQYWTTVGYTIAAPDNAEGKDGFDQWETLTHELIHTQQAQRWTRPIFTFFYFWPLSQGVLIILTCWIPILFFHHWTVVFVALGWLIFGLIHFIPSLSDYWRAKWELEAYNVSMYLRFKRLGYLDNDYVESRAEQFFSMAYYRMIPNEEKAKKLLRRQARLIIMGKHPVKDLGLVALVERLRQDKMV